MRVSRPLASLAGAAAVLSFAACGSSASDDPGDPTPTGTTDTQEAGASDNDASSTKDAATVADASADGGDSGGGDSSGGDSGGGTNGSIVTASRLAAAGARVYAITATDALRGWGEGYPTPQPMPNGVPGTWSYVEAGPSQGCAIKAADHSLWCATGLMNFGSKSPDPWSAVSVGTSHACAIRTTGELYCWGSNIAGERGTGTAPETDLMRVGADTDFRRVSAGHRHTLALKSNGSLVAWGSNVWGELGDNGASGSFALTPVVVDPTPLWIDVEAGIDFSCGIQKDHTLHCWGTKGYLGIGSKIPKKVGASADWARVRTGGNNICALKTNGSIWCSGSNGYGQLGGAVDAAEGFARIDSSTDWVDVAVGGVASRIDDGSVCGRKADGTVQCWGSNIDGQLGTGIPSKSTPRKIGAGYARVAANGASTCAVTDAGVLQCWGEIARLGLGLGRRAVPTKIGGDTDWSDVALGNAETGTVGAHYACASKTGGALYCWGSALAGELGIGMSGASAPQAVGLSVQSFALGRKRTCAVTKAGALYCWGSGTSTPTLVDAAGWKLVGVGADKPRALKDDGTLWTVPPGGAALDASTTWTALVGHGTAGMFGLDAGALRSVGDAAGPPSAATDWMAYAVGATHRCGIRTPGTIQCTGSNSDRQFGDLSGMNDFTRVATGDRHTCGIRANGDLYCWGRNDDGEVGDGTTFRAQPMPIP